MMRTFVIILVGMFESKKWVDSFLLASPPPMNVVKLKHDYEPSKLMETSSLEIQEQKPPMDEFDLNKGRCIDVLREDYAVFFDRDLRYEIYTKGLRIVDPSGVEIWGLAAYRQFFAAVRLFRKMACDDVSMMRLNTQYDANRQQIILQWYSKWNVKGAKEPAYVSAVSTFHLNNNGHVHKHVVDRIMFNGKQMGTPVDALYGLRRNFVRSPVACPGCSDFDFLKSIHQNSQYTLSLKPTYANTVQLLQANEEDNDAPPGSSGGAVVAEDTSKKNKPKSTGTQSKPRQKGGLLAKCEYMWDCEAPLNCCDFIAVKVCCGGGQGIPAFLQPPAQPRAIPIPVPVDPYPGQRPRNPPPGPW
uniref:Uncharacterized protein n=1 Tax=Aureoumbra lagunensis TaxID=44058 RepID=A0A7S3JV21_9STRA|mmetsp:Transcript_2683/g.3657  ORF Transcript_2683/g.3657 Transcript_2683/m.3657 type:complete len:358 (-) Transcript_2683:304-1377(-)